MDEMPFTDVPTCVISIDFYDKGSHPVMAVVLSVNKNFSKFCSIVLEKDGKIEVNIRNAIYNAIELVNYN